jgi:eukaryotic-like serine/threonine-protein kinase
MQGSMTNDHGSEDATIPDLNKSRGFVDTPRLEEATVRRLGRYVVLGELGRGGMGEVLNAYDSELERNVALKLLHAEHADHAPRLKREAQALAKVSHPNVVQVFEVGVVEGQAFVAMELVRGQTLRQWQEQHPRPDWRACVQVYLRAGRGLAAAHAAGLVHRDFKPSNCIVDHEQRARVLDFGLVRKVDGVPNEASDDDSDSIPTEGPHELEALEYSLTQTGMVMGTVSYMAPEQMRGEPADARSDLFSFCVSLYEAIHGTRPFAGHSIETLYAASMASRVQPAPTGTRVPAKLRRILLRGLAARPEDRWSSMTELLVELRRVVEPRRWRWLALGVAGCGLAGMGLGLSQYAAVGFRCEGAAAQLDGIWDELRKQEVKAAMLGTGLSYAPDTWERVEHRLDEHAHAWVAKHTEVCEATRVTESQTEQVMDLRMRCLNDRRNELRAAVGVLAHADGTKVEKAMALMAGLQAPSRCDELEALAAELPLPEDPEIAAQVQALRKQLVEVRVRLSVGDFVSSAREVQTLVEQIETLGYGPLLADALYLRGRARHAIGKYPEAEEDLDQAYLLALEHDLPDIEANVAILSTVLVGVQGARYEESLWWGATALALAKRAGASERVEARARVNLATVLKNQGRLAESMKHLERALAIYEETLEPQQPEFATTLDAMGTVLRDQGKLGEALAHHERALVIRQRLLGPRHPDMIGSWLHTGVVLMALGRLDEALRYVQRAIAIAEEVGGTHHSAVAIARMSLGMVLSKQGRLDEALEQHGRALAILQEALGPRHPNMASAMTNMANVLSAQGKFDEALEHNRNALAIIVEASGPRHHMAGTILGNIASELGKQGKLNEALEHYDRALDILEEALGPQHPTVANMLSGRGTVLRKQGRLDEALEHFERAIAINEAALGPQHEKIAETLVESAKAELALQDFAAARRLADRAVTIRESGSAQPHLLAEARFVLAQASWPDHAQRSRARSLAEQARSAYAALGASHGDALAQAQTWLAEHRLP